MTAHGNRSMHAGGEQPYQAGYDFPATEAYMDSDDAVREQDRVHTAPLGDSRSAVRSASGHSKARGEALHQRPAVLQFSSPRQPATASRGNHATDDSSDDYDCELLSSDSDEA